MKIMNKMWKKYFLTICSSLLLLPGYLLASAETKGVLERHEFVLADFEDEDSLAKWNFSGTSAELSDAWATRGSRSALVTWHPGDWQTFVLHAENFADWPDFAEFEYLHVDMWNPTDDAQPIPGDNSHNIRIRTEDGSRVASVSSPLAANEFRTFKITLHRPASPRFPEIEDISTTNRVIFRAWNASIDYIRHIDNIRLTRDLGRYFSEFEDSFRLLQAVGMQESNLNRLRENTDEVQQQLTATRFSKENFITARNLIAELKTEIERENIIYPAYLERIHRVILSERHWTAPARRELAAINAELLEAREKIREIARGLHPMGSFVNETLDRINDELRIIEAATANAREALPYGTPENGLILGWQHTATFVQPYGKPFTGSFEQIVLSGARGEKTGVQLVAFALDQPVENLSLSMSFTASDDLPEQQMELFALGFMNLGRAAEGSAAYLTQWYPDILYPAPSDGISVPAGALQPFVLQVDIPRDLEAGHYRFEVVAESEIGTVSLPAVLRVYDFSVPERFTLKTTSGYRSHAAREMIPYGMDAGHIYGGWRGADEELILDFHERGQQLFQLEHLSNARVNLMLERGEEWVSNRYEPFLQKMEELGIPREHFFFYGLDEHSPGHADRVRKVDQMVNSVLGIPFMSTPLGSGWLEQPADTMSIWAAGLGRGEARRGRIAEIHEAGSQAWWYDNDLGFAPDLWNSRHKGWYAKHWDMDGYLIYSHRAWTDRDGKNLDRSTLPYSNWREPGGASAALTYYWMEGEEMKGYPAFRLWSFRDGLYDHDYLVKLEGLVEEFTRTGIDEQYESLLTQARQLVAVPEYIVAVPDTVEATTGETVDAIVAGADPVPAMLIARSQVAKMIEILSRIRQTKID